MPTAIVAAGTRSTYDFSSNFDPLFSRADIPLIRQQSSETYISGAHGSDAIVRRGSPVHSDSNGSLGNPPRYPVALEMPAPLASQSAHLSPASSSTSLEPALVPDLPPKPFDDSAYPRDAREGYDTDGENERLFASPPIGSDGSFSPEPEAASPRGRESFASNNPFAGPGQRRSSRGISLRDDGPAPGSRVVQRNSQGHRSRTSNSFTDFQPPGPNGSQGGSLPPGAAPPRHSMSGQR